MTQVPSIVLSVTDKYGGRSRIERVGGLKTYSIGRGYEADDPDPAIILIPDAMVSPRHCSIEWDEIGSWILRDVGSVNGTVVAGEVLKDSHRLGHGSEFKIGGSVLRLDFALHDSDDAPTEAESAAVDADDDPTPVAPVDEDQTMLDPDRGQIGDGEPFGIAQPGLGDGADQLMYADTAQSNGSGLDQTLEMDRDPLVGEDLRPAAPRPRLRGEIAALVEAGLLDETAALDYMERAQENGETFFARLVRDHRVGNINKIFDWVSRYLNCDNYTDIEHLMEVAREEPWLPASVAERRGVILLEPGPDGVARYATIFPFDIVLHDWVERCVGGRAEVSTVIPSIFRDAINRLRHKPVADEDQSEIIPIVIPYEEELRIRDNLDTQAVPRIVEFLIHRAYVQRASDIHVEPTEAGVLVRNRVDGMLHDENLLPHEFQRAITSRIKILSNMDVAERRRPQDGRVSVKINEVPIDIRTSSYPTVHGEKIVMRMLDKSTLSPTPDDLGLSDRDLQKLLDKINAPLGLIMLSGPTGSGKTTTLYSCLGSIDRTIKNVLTVEDPVEYQLDGVHQMQVNEKIGLTFAAGMRTILRQDPDVIMVGECRDAETAAMAIQASLTGHIVFSTIHSNDAVGVVTRLLDMNIDPFLVSSALTLAIAQRLVRTVCKQCSRPVRGSDVLRRLYEDGVSDEKLENLGIQIDPDIDYVSPSGCASCRDTGYVGRRAVFEIFEMTKDCRQIVMSNNFDPSDLEAVALKIGMRTLVENGLHLVEEGVTTHAEVIRVLGERYK
jgi:type II secretory ATPase GspE/PulE/Tfp pilus assembly ATPase PilB-like protein/pSer/pThr/pTyr-binding forkhead associated (FHA) protein